MTNDTDRERDILAQLVRASEALRDTLDMFVDDDLDSADLVIVHNIDYARAALDAATSYLTDLPVDDGLDIPVSLRRAAP